MDWFLLFTVAVIFAAILSGGARSVWNFIRWDVLGFPLRFYDERLVEKAATAVACEAASHEVKGMESASGHTFSELEKVECYERVKASMKEVLARYIRDFSARE